MFLIYARKLGLTQMSCEGNMLPDMQESFSPTSTQLLTPLSWPTRHHPALDPLD